MHVSVKRRFIYLAEVLVVFPLHLLHGFVCCRINGLADGVVISNSKKKRCPPELPAMSTTLNVTSVDASRSGVYSEEVVDNGE